MSIQCRCSSPEADDESNNNLDGWNEPANQVRGNNRLDNFRIGRKTIEELTNAHSIEESHILAKHVSQNQRPQAARATGSCNRVQDSRKESQQCIGNVDGQEHESNPVKLVLTHRQVGETNNVNKPTNEEVLRHVKEGTNCRKEGGGNDQRELRFAEAQQPKRGNLLRLLIFLLLLQSITSRLTI